MVDGGVFQLLSAVLPSFLLCLAILRFVSPKFVFDEDSAKQSV